MTSVIACAPASRARCEAWRLSVEHARRRRGGVAGGVDAVARGAVRMMPVPSGFVSTSASPGCAPRLREDCSGCMMPVTARPYFGSASYSVWPPAMTPPASATFSAPPRRISPRIAGSSVLRERDDVQRHQHLAAHRVDVAHRVGGGDRAVRVRVVDDGREEVDGLDDREVVAQAVDGGVVRAIEPDEEVGEGGGVERLRDRREDLRKHRDAGLAAQPAHDASDVSADRFTSGHVRSMRLGGWR